MKKMNGCLLLALSLCLFSKAQNVGIGITNPVRAKLEVNGAVGATSAIFGGDAGGISLQRNAPGVGFNQYYSGGGKYISNGYGAVQWFDHTVGYMALDLYGNGVANGNGVGAKRAFTIGYNGNMGIGSASINGQLQLDNQLKNRKLVLYESANNDFQYYGLGIEAGAMRYNIDAPGAAHRFYAGTGIGSSNLLMSIGGNQVIQMGSGSAKVGINTLPYAPQTALEINGGVSLRTSTVTVSNVNPTITVGDRSYIYITSGQQNVQVSIFLTNGISAGQILVLESAAANNFIGVDLDNTTNLKLAGGGMRIQGEETLTLIWNGTKWVELSRSNNY